MSSACVQPHASRAGPGRSDDVIGHPPLASIFLSKGSVPEDSLLICCHDGFLHSKPSNERAVFSVFAHKIPGWILVGLTLVTCPFLNQSPWPEENGLYHLAGPGVHAHS